VFSITYFLERCLRIREDARAPISPPMGIQPLSKPDASGGSMVVGKMRTTVSMGMVAR